MVKPKGIVLPKGSKLFHGSIEDIEGDLRGGGYDGVLWFADVPAVAQLYIPRAGLSMYASSGSVGGPSRDPEIQSVQAIIGLRFDLDRVRWGRGGRAESYAVPEGWEDVGLNFAWNEEVERRLALAGYDGEGTPGFKQYKFHFANRRLLPPGGVQQGQLCVATTKRDLVLWPKAHGEGDLTQLQYHDVAGFRSAAEAGYDGVMIDDFAQSEAWGNFGHLSVGIFAGSLDALETTCVPATYEEFQASRFHTDAWPDASLRPYFDDLLETRARNPEHDEDPWLYHVTFYRNLGDIAQHGLRPGSGRGIGGGVYDEHRQGAVFLTSEDGIGFWASRAEEWAHYSSDDLYEDGLVPVLLRVPTEDAEGCTDDHLGTADAKADAFRCTGVHPDTLEVWAGTEDEGEWVSIDDWGDIDLDAAFEEEEGEYDDEGQPLRSLRGVYPGPLIPGEDARTQAEENPRRQKRAARARHEALKW